MATGGGGELRPLQQFCEAIGCTLCNRAVPAAPKTLHCLHSFCEDCLVRYANGLPDDDRRRELPCPTCDVEQNPPLLGNGSEAVVQNLPTNLFFENFSRHVARDTARHSDPGLIQCEDCEKAGRKADTFCTVCRISLCDRCVERHRDARRTERHELVDKRTNPARHGRWNCPQHENAAPGHCNVEVYLYCTDCRVLQCQTCRATHEPGHRSTTALEAYRDQNHVDRAAQQSDETAQMERVFATTVGQLETLKQQLEERKGNAEAEIDRKTEAVRQALEEESRRLKQDANSIFEQKTTHLNRQIRQLEEIQEKFKHSLYITKGSLEFGEAEDILLVEEPLVRGLQGLRERFHNYDHTPCENDMINFEENYRPNMRGILGRVLSDATNPDLLIPGLGGRPVDTRFYADNL